VEQNGKFADIFNIKVRTSKNNVVFLPQLLCTAAHSLEEELGVLCLLICNCFLTCILETLVKHRDGVIDLSSTYKMGRTYSQACTQDIKCLDIKSWMW
jgi:hypothetical protein